MHGIKQHLTNFFHKISYNWKSRNASRPDNQSMGNRANLSRWFHLHCNFLVINTHNAASSLNFYTISCKLLLSKRTYSFIKPTRLKMIFSLNCEIYRDRIENMKGSNSWTDLHNDWYYSWDWQYQSNYK